MVTLYKAICTFNEMLNKIPIAFFTEIQQTIIYLAWNQKRFEIGKAILTRKNKANRATMRKLQQTI